eukprot:jgi/Picsp_1/1864/NSC_05331-R1_---NA---
MVKIEQVDLTSDWECRKETDKGTNCSGEIVVNNGKADHESIKLNTEMQEKKENFTNNLVESIEKIEKRKQELKEKMASMRKLDTVLPQVCRKYRCGFIYNEGLLSVPSQTEQEMGETRFFRSQTGYTGIHRRMFKKLDDDFETDSDNPYDDSPAVDEDRVEEAAKRMALKIWVKRNMSQFEEKIQEFIFPPSLVERARKYRKRVVQQKKKRVLECCCLEQQNRDGVVPIRSDSKENATGSVQKKQGDAVGKGDVSRCLEMESGCTLVM